MNNASCLASYNLIFVSLPSFNKWRLLGTTSCGSSLLSGPTSFPASPSSPFFTYLSLLIRPDSLAQPAYSHLWSFAHTAFTWVPLPTLSPTEHLLILQSSAQPPYSMTNSCFSWLPRMLSSPVWRGFEDCLVPSPSDAWALEVDLPYPATHPLGLAWVRDLLAYTSSGNLIHLWVAQLESPSLIKLKSASLYYPWA